MLILVIIIIIIIIIRYSSLLIKTTIRDLLALTRLHHLGALRGSQGLAKG